MEKFWRRALGFVDVRDLVPHEQVIEQHVEELVEELTRDGIIRQPIIVDRDSMVILDGHHRATAIKRLNYRFIPAYLVDYNDPRIGVSARRPDIPVSKDSVIRTGLGGVPYPPFTSRHEWPCAPDPCPVALEYLDGETMRLVAIG